MNKINENIASAYLESHYDEIKDEIKDEIHKLSSRKNFPGILQAIINLLRFLQEKGQIQKIGLHIKVIGRLYNNGNDYLKYIIENLFIRSFEGIRKRCTTHEWNALYKQIPVNLKKIYLLQNQEQSHRTLSI
ncbi:DUF7674 family protein [Sphingobacterium bovistauri]|uniref:DUF7674 domain-containing protein n=1 Tax=Sphingobacterium bovistauri TaxID=2781959 RepID=A0ABS7Z9D0_9SPHI|nr:hypothetical protein [Sphingobacterium bovistauri]MCA5005559.1 hypothetical protein [Sphingobacterium bovistauri]